MSPPDVGDRSPVLATDRLVQGFRAIAEAGGPEESDDARLETLLREAHRSIPPIDNPGIARALSETLGPDIAYGTVQGYAYRKPRGYAGDFEIIDKMYREETAHAPELATWDRYYHRQPAAKAVRNRKAFFHDRLHALRRHQAADCHVLDLASGPCRDLFEFFSDSRARDLFVDCVETDPEAISFALKLNGAFAQQLRFVPTNVFRFKPVRRYDLVWSAGLFDYLAGDAFVKLLRRCLSWVAPGGEVIVGNFSTQNPTRPYMELVTDWRLHHRSPGDLLRMAEAAGAPIENASVESEDEGVNLFLAVRVPGSRSTSTRRASVVGVGACAPAIVLPNASFHSRVFFDRAGEPVKKTGAVVVERFREITGICERRHAPPEQTTSDLAARAGQEAIAAAGLRGEELDAIVVAHNWGDVGDDGVPDAVPNLAARVKNKLGIRNRSCVAYDVVFGCSGWLQALIQADAFIRLNEMRNVLVIGADAISRVVDPDDVDSLLFGDGAGAAVVAAASDGSGLLAHASISHCEGDLSYLTMGTGYGPRGCEDPRRFLKMRGREVFRFAVRHVPPLVLKCLAKAGVELDSVSKILVHQANGRLVRAVVERTAELAGLALDVDTVAPLSVTSLGNCSVATIPMLWDAVASRRLPGHTLDPGSVVVLAAVGAGMHATCAAYRLADRTAEGITE